MKARFSLLAMAALLAVPAFAQDIPAGPDVWDTQGAGSTTVTLSGADWGALCGASSGNATVSLKGFNLPGQGTGDTIVNRLDYADLTSSSTANVNIQLAALSMVSDGSHPCSPATLRVVASPPSSQRIGGMTITRTSSAGGTFTAVVPIDADITAVDSAGNPVGRTVHIAGDLGDTSGSPWAYPTTTAAAAPIAWNPGVDPVTKQKVKVCRRGNKILPAIHCYQPPPKCKVVIQPGPVEPIGPIEGEPIGGIGVNRATQPQPIDDRVEPCYADDATPVG